MNPYSTAKPAFHTDKIVQLRHKEQPDPTHVQLIISDFCNHDCSFCAYRMSNYTSNEMFQLEAGTSRKARNPRRMIDTAKCYEIIDDCYKMGVKAIQFTGGGEPTVHPDFAEIVSYAQASGIETSLVTNGCMFLDEDIRSAVLNMKWVRVSIDAAYVDTYCGMRDVGEKMWHRMLTGVTTLINERIDGTPVIGAGFVVTPTNHTEILYATEKFKNLGFDNMRIGLMFNPENSKPFEPFRKQIEEDAKKAEDFSSDSFTVINRASEKLSELDTGNPTFDFCSYQHFTTYIGGDLNVYRCCVYAYHHRGLIGSLKEQRFIDLWRSEAKEDNMAHFRASQCERCQFTEIIQRTNQVIDGDPLPDGPRPTHVNFT